MNTLQKWLLGLGLGLAAAIVAWLVSLTGFFASVEMKTYDLRMSRTADPATANKNIVLVNIDERSITGLEPLVGRWPWPRVAHAEVIDFLASAGAKVIAVDVLFSERDARAGFPVGESTMTGEESDAALVEATRRAGNVVYITDFTNENDQVGQPTVNVGDFKLDDTIEKRPNALAPFPALSLASRSLASSFFVLDTDGPMRWIVPFVAWRDKFIPELGVAAALVAGGYDAKDVRVDPGHIYFRDRAMPTSHVPIPRFSGNEHAQKTSRRALINYVGPSVLPDGKTTVYPTYSWYSLFYAQQQIHEGQKPDLDPALFKDKIVFIGLSAAGLHDVFATPFVGAGEMAGIQVHGAMTEQILSGRFIEKSAPVIGIVAILSCALVVGALGVVFSAWWGAGVALLTSVVYGAVAFAMFKRGLWIPLAAPQLGTALALFMGVGYHYLVEGREKRKVAKLFGRYVSKDVYAQLMANPGSASLGGQRRDMSVLFSDIRGFTTLSEAGTPESVVHTLNEYFTQMVRVVFEHKGTLDKFVGDMVMALFGAPVDDPEHADHAIGAAIDMIKELGILNDRWGQEGRVLLDIGVGINSGDMVAGNIGSESIMAYTVIGDNVNLGSRLESLCKSYGAHIIISESTAKQTRHGWKLRELDLVVVKGKTEPVAIFEVLDYHTAESFPNIDEAIGVYGRALAHYRAQEWDQAVAAFRECQRLSPPDKLPAIYIDRCEYWRAHPPDAGWSGVWVMKSK